MSEFYDNHSPGRAAVDAITGMLASDGAVRADFCIGYFNLRGWGEVMDYIENLPGETVWEGEEESEHHRVCRVIIGMPVGDDMQRRWLRQQQGARTLAYQGAIAQGLNALKEDAPRQLELGCTSDEHLKILRCLSSQMHQGKVSVKMYAGDPLHAKVYITHYNSYASRPVQAMTGSSNLTYAGLKSNGEMNAQLFEAGDPEYLSQWFDNLWDDPFSKDVTDVLMQAIDNSWAREEPPTPYQIYLKTAYHLSEEARAGVAEYVLPPRFSRVLFDYQRTAVQVATKHLRNPLRGGAMIGDVVGLGKTITACAIAKIYENTSGTSTLIICPANLQEMWKQYVKDYDLKADVISVAKEFNPDNMRYYPLVIIDESHNLRGGPKGQRYTRIKTLLDRQGSNVLLLTATPYNKDYKDLYHQLHLFVDDEKDLGIRPEKFIEREGGETAFLREHPGVPIRSLAAFNLSDEADDWQQLMRLFLIRRTRSFIRRFCAETDPTNNRQYLCQHDGKRNYFPDRVAVPIRVPMGDNDQYRRMCSQEMLDMVESLKLPRYGLGQYVDKETRKTARGEDEMILEKLSKAGESLKGFCKATFFKRLDSCAPAFILTLTRHLFRNYVFLHALDNGLPLPLADTNLHIEAALHYDYASDLVPEDGDDEQKGYAQPYASEGYHTAAPAYYHMLQQCSDISFIPKVYFTTRLREDLLADCQVLHRMLELCGVWNPADDQKLNHLQHLIIDEKPDDKFVVFTQYSDTANYIYHELVARGVKNIEIVTGDSDDPTDTAKRFSPHSNGLTALSAEEQIRILIATDVLSEGQNLQDCANVVNYDLPWAIIRLIQRAGRVDRIGQQSETVNCYSFFPIDDVENIISLRTRLIDRLNNNAQTLGSDEKFFEGTTENLTDLFNGRDGVLDDAEEDDDVDLTSYAYQIWQKAQKEHPDITLEVEALPNMVYTTRTASSSQAPGVITYARTATGFDILTYIDAEGHLLPLSAMDIFEAMKCSPDTPTAAVLPNHHTLVAQALQAAQERSRALSTEGIMGGRSSLRSRLMRILDGAMHQPTDLFTTLDHKQLETLMNEIQRSPLLPTTRTAITHMLNSRQSSIPDILEYLWDQYQASLLTRSESADPNMEPVIKCSMGLAPHKNSDTQA